jgi:hypothetical protein
VTCTNRVNEAGLLFLAVIGLGFVAVSAAAYRFKRLTLLLLAVPLVVPAIFVAEAWMDAYFT